MRSPIKTFGDDVAGPLGRRALSFSCVGPGDKAAILDLYAFIDWVMVLPKPFELEYLDEIEHFEQEKSAKVLIHSSTLQNARAVFL